jgi:lipoprotein-releasing system ATP-binding protein
MSDPLLSVRRVTKTYNQGPQKLEILKGIDADFYPGEATCIVGSSGAGKSTLLHIIGALDHPTSGQVLYKNENLFDKSDEDLAQFRNKTIGFVFQFHHLLSEFTALENIMMPARIAGEPVHELQKRAEKLISMMGLNERAHHYPSELSGGEQQRVAVARALIQNPKILLADEPTGNLDTENSRQIQELFFNLKHQFGLTLIVVTHDSNFASRFPRRLILKDGHWN